MIETTWERAETVEFPILWWLAYDDSLAVFKTYKKAETVNLPLFEFVGITLEMDDPKELVVIDGRQPYQMRLPYTAQALANRAVNGGDLPTDISGQIAVIEEAKVA